MDKRLLEILNRNPSKWGNLTVKEFERDIKLLQEYAEEIWKKGLSLADDYIELREQSQHYRRTLEFASGELEHAYVTGDIGRKDELIKKTVTSIDNTLEELK